MPRQIGYVIGSLRKESINRKLANALIKLGPYDKRVRTLSRQVTIRNAFCRQFY